MDIAVFGLGYVGSVSAACLASEGHSVLGVDPDRRKTDAIREGRAPQGEPGLADLVATAVASGSLRIAEDVAGAVAESELALVCVGTPSREGGALDLTAVARVSEEIGQALADRRLPYGIVVRSTCLPGSLAIVAEAVSRTCPEADDRIALATNPEFLREGSAIEDFRAPPFTIIGTRSAWLAERLQELYRGIPGPRFVVRPEEAQALKYACNAYHAAKVVFANELGRLFRRLGADGRRVMEIFCEDEILNISPAYLRPGFSYGGSCLPKDVRALVCAAKHRDVDVPLLESLERSNRLPVEDAVQIVTERGRPRVALVGLSFKPRTDDMRESPYIELVERLSGKGLAIRVFDPDVQWTDVFGANRQFVESEIPHLAEMLVPDLLALGPAEVVLLAKRVPGLKAWLSDLPAETLVLDLCGVIEEGAEPPFEYRGIAW